MRVIGGEFRSRRLQTLPGMDTRPTPDRLRESLFNVLAPEIEDAAFLDAYAGTGAVGIEALSRGAAKCIFIERSKEAVEVIRKNVRELGLERRSEILQGKVLEYLRHRKADIVFLDPPYTLERDYAEAMTLLDEEPHPLVVAQHSVRFELAAEYGGLRRTRVLRQGDNALSFYRPLVM
ncbi:MAG TPA: 16S rRNA (guanine(966)-N(2))-methyltransferase RsmD [Bryobacteraceae bacterium]|nr:16S rRNA (guanine(966)-N(2))-methyltransferase RsmD [Bryobacteraceae bacterium]